MSSPFLRHLLLNLRITVMILIAAVGVIVLYALLSKQEASWEILVFLGIGMTFSSLLNAWRDAKREKEGTT
jgi:hypothetical protein